MRNGLVRTLVVSLIVVLLLTQKHSGFMLAFVLANNIMSIGQ